MNRLAILALVALVPLGNVTFELAIAQEKGAGKKAERNAARKEAAAQPMAITPEREAAVMTFVDRNHPELRQLLALLKETRSREYEKAIRDIYRESDRLANLKDRDPKQYELEVRRWTIRSKIQLATARMAMEPTDELRSRLKTLLNEQVEVRAELLRHERDRTQKRLARVEEDLAKIEADRDAFVDRQLELLMKSAEASQPKGRKAGKNTARRGGGKKPAKSTVNQPDRPEPKGEPKTP